MFSNGVVLLAAAAAALIIGFDANLDRLIQLYIVGVFTSFTLSQFGMVRHWQTRCCTGTARPLRPVRGDGGAGRSVAPGDASMRRAQAINAVGAVFTAVVLVVVFATKVAHGAWIAVARDDRCCSSPCGPSTATTAGSPPRSPPTPTSRSTLPSRVHALVLVSRLHKPALRALALARAIRPDALTALTLTVDADETRRLRREWEQPRHPGAADDAGRPLPRPDPPAVQLRQASCAGPNPQTVIMVFIPEYVVTQWWQQLLHNQSALRFKARLLFTPGVVVVDVPYHLGVGDQGWLGGQASAKIEQPADRPLSSPANPQA